MQSQITTENKVRNTIKRFWIEAMFNEGLVGWFSTICMWTVQTISSILTKTIYSYLICENQTVIVLLLLRGQSYECQPRVLAQNFVIELNFYHPRGILLNRIKVQYFLQWKLFLVEWTYKSLCRIRRFFDLFVQTYVFQFHYQKQK